MDDENRIIEYIVVTGSSVYGLELADLHDLEEVGSHGDYALHHEQVNDGKDAGALTRLLTRDEAGAPRPVKRWGAPPTIHAAPGTTAEQAAEVRLIVKYINSALPPDWQLRWSDERREAPADPRRVFHDDRIQVVFAPAGAWPEAGDTTLGLTRFRFDNNEIQSARIWVDPELRRNEYKPVRLKVIAHELLHALGREHADPDQFRETILHAQVDEVPAIAPVLRQLDNEALLAVYGFLEAGQDGDAVRQALGAWKTWSTHLGATLSFGAAGRLGFGASERNGLARPWAVGGPVPEVDLLANGSLGESARWAGRLAGLTPGSAPVAGDAAMTVDIGSSSHRLDFTNLEVWAAGAAPGAAGSGDPWGDGDLAYAIEVTGNGFRHAAGSQDEGEIEGFFLGEEHEAMVGVLRRRDLSAGFGGVRR